MIDEARGFLFVHIPKTAGSSVTEAFGASWQNHKDLARYRRELGAEKLEKLFKFTIVRNPWDRLVSDFCFQRRLGGHRATKLHVLDDRGRRRSFPEWAREVLENPYHYAPKIWGGSVSEGLHRWSPQWDWISLSGKLAVDYVGRMENLPEHYAELCARLDWPARKLPHKKKSRRPHYSQFYDDATRELVTDYYQSDIEAFGYEFESEPSAWWQRMLPQLSGRN